MRDIASRIVNLSRLEAESLPITIVSFVGAQAWRHGPVTLPIPKGIPLLKAEQIARGRVYVRIFGSAARGEADVESDIDILVDLEPGRSLLDHAALLLDLQQLLGCKVDVVTIRGLRERIREWVLQEAIPLWQKMVVEQIEAALGWKPFVSLNMPLIRCDCAAQRERKLGRLSRQPRGVQHSVANIRSAKPLAFGRPSPINQQIYPFKTVHVIFADEPDEIVIVTVLVYYGK